MSHRVSSGVHLPRRLLGGRAGMYPHLGKVVAKARFHEGAYCWLQRPARTGKDVINTGRRLAHLHLTGGSPPLALDRRWGITDTGLYCRCHYL
ncbi:MAG TPA: hypothetical protein PKE64_30505, partial [Anaerolineae bacterium]|nr:hypothetical protein [Anaerolineae bacterium]